MALSTDIITQFVKATDDRRKTSSESTVFGTVTVKGDRTYVKIDGSDQLTPVSTTAKMSDGQRVTVQIKDHAAIATGNVTSPAIRDEDAENIASETTIEKIGYYDELNTQKFEAVNGNITNLEASHAKFKEAVIRDLTAEDGTITNLNAKYANVDFANIGEAAIKKFYATSGVIEDIVISGGKVTGTLVGVTIKGDLIEGGTVVADKLVVRGNDGLYYKLNTSATHSSSRTNYVKMDTVVTPNEEGSLVENAITNTEDPVYSYTDIDGNTAYYTIVDEVYYAVELSADEVAFEQTEYNSLNGSIITAKTVTATQISVDDLVAFDATIAGFNMTDGSLYSGAKESVNNTTTGVYMDSDAQFAIGDNNNYLKFYKDENDNYKLDISAASVSLYRNLAEQDSYVKTETVIEAVEGEIVDGVLTSDGNQVYSYINEDGNIIYYTIVDEKYYSVDLVSTSTKTDLNSAFEDVNNKITETKDGLSQEIESQKSDYQAFKSKFSKYIRFMEDENGNSSDTAIIIGSGDSAITLEIDNETGIIFKKNGVQFGLWDGVDFHTGNIVVEVNERAQLGNFAYVPRSDGSLSFLKVGG